MMVLWNNNRIIKGVLLDISGVFFESGVGVFIDGFVEVVKR